jgi:hypothetical protein
MIHSKLLLFEYGSKVSAQQFVCKYVYTYMYIYIHTYPCIGYGSIGSNLSAPHIIPALFANAVHIYIYIYIYI